MTKFFCTDDKVPLYAYIWIRCIVLIASRRSPRYLALSRSFAHVLDLYELAVHGAV